MFLICLNLENFKLQILKIAKIGLFLPYFYVYKYRRWNKANFGNFQVFKFEILKIDTYEEHEGLQGESCTKCKVFHVLSPGVPLTSSLVPYFEKSRKSGIFGYSGGPKKLGGPPGEKL